MKHFLESCWGLGMEYTNTFLLKPYIVQQWRAERKKKIELPQIVIAPANAKKWSLEDDDDEDVEESGASLAEDEVDPLDAYMQVSQESLV